MILSLVILLAVAVVPLGGAKNSPVQADDFLRVRGTAIGPEEEYVPDQLIVKFKDRAASAAEDEFNESLGTRVIYSSRYAGFKVLKIPEGKTVTEMVRLCSKQSIVEYAEPNYIRRALWSPNDLYYSDQWHFDQINMEAAWDLDTTPPNYGGDSSVIVAILDTGVAYENYGVYKKGPDFASSNFVQGWDFVNNDAHPNDDDGHGTFVCGVLAESTDNALGVAGIAFNTAILPVKVLPGGMATEIEGIYHAANNGARIINISLGGSGTGTTERDALAYAYNVGITIICGAGNEYEKGNPPQYPAAYDDYCIAVGATRYDQTRAPYSNTGSYLDIVAPGGDMDVDQNGDGEPDGILQQTFATGQPTNFGYYWGDGTSFACPHVAGVAALILAKNPSLTPDQVREALQSTATDLGTPGRDNTYGWGLLNAPAAILWTPNTSPNTPFAPSPANHATGVSINADVSWTGGDPDAGDTVTYDVYLGTSSSPSLLSDNQAATTYDPGILAYNTTYYWYIAATDNHGTPNSGPTWDFTTESPDNPPFTPSSPSPLNHATNISINADISWTGGDADLGDTVTYDIYLGTSWPAPFRTTIGSYAATQSPITHDPGPLMPGTTYYWRIVARDNHGVTTEGSVWDFTTGGVGAVAVSIVPATYTAAVGETFTVDIQLSGAELVRGASAYIDFDTNYLEVQSITPGTTLDTVLQNDYDNAAGTIDYAAGKLSGTLPTGTFTLATIELKALAETSSTPLTFVFEWPGRVTDVITTGAVTVLGTVTDGEITIAPVTVKGQVAFQGRPAPPDARWVNSLTVMLYEQGTGTLVDTCAVTTNATGGFSLAFDQPVGTYDIGVKGSHTLSRLEEDVVIAGGITNVNFGTLLEGDCDNNDMVNIGDFGILADAFGSLPASGNWDERADLDSSGAVNISDFGLLADNFGLLGEMV